MPETPKTYLAKVEYLSTADTSLVATGYSNVDSFLYNNQNEIVGIKTTSFYNGRLRDSSNQVFRRQANKIYTSTGNGLELYAATLEPVFGNIISSAHIRDYSSDGEDSVYWWEDGYEYSTSGFLQQQIEKFNIAY